MEVFDLIKLGWNDFFAEHLSSLKSAGFEIGRVALENRHQYLLYTKSGEITAETTGRLLHNAESSADLPKVGDWVTFTVSSEEKAIIHEVLPRKSIFSRKVVGRKVEEQVVATNVDTVFIVQALDNDFSLRRLERYLVMIHAGNATPVIVLNKTDLCENLAEKLEEVRKVVGNTSIISISAKTGLGLAELKSFIHEGLTYAFTGSSGVGKSTLLNRLFSQEIQKTHDVRESDSRGQHTTTTRKMFILPQGGLLIDTPGMREIQLWYGEEGLSDTFSDFNELSTTCHFSNCTHTKEIKCSVLEALAHGEILAERYESFIKLRKESEALAAKQSVSKYIERKQEHKRSQKAFNKIKRSKNYT